MSTFITGVTERVPVETSEVVCEDYKSRGRKVLGLGDSKIEAR
jgi:hypothetical protein